MINKVSKTFCDAVAGLKWSSAFIVSTIYIAVEGSSLNNILFYHLFLVH